ncbi:uncharacterized protein V6R79_008494 [Siganus canaliculatus]
MFQRLSNLLFGEVEEVEAELKGPNPCVTEADEEGWMIVNLSEPGCMMQVEDETGTPLIAPSLPESNQSNHQDTHTRTECLAHVPHKRRRTHKGRARGAAAPSDPLPCPSANPSDLGAATPVTLPRRARLSTPSTPSISPGSGSDCEGSGGSSRAGPERGCMDESWFVTPPPCFTAEGATAEASPMEDLLIEHPSMSVYVSSNNFSMVSNSNLSVVGEESVVSLASSVSRVAEPAAAPATRSTTMPTRVSRGAAAQVGPLAKVTQVARIQRSKARIERRHLSRNRIQRQNLTREKAPRHAAHARNTFLHQPSKRNICH